MLYCVNSTMQASESKVYTVPGSTPERIPCSIHLLHLGSLICSALHFLQWGEVIVVTQALIIVIDAQAQFDHAVDAACELCWLVKVEARGEQRSVKEEPDQVLYGLVRLV